MGIRRELGSQALSLMDTKSSDRNFAKKKDLNFLLIMFIFSKIEITSNNDILTEILNQKSYGKYFEPCLVIAVSISNNHISRI